jgi:putative membrane protein
LALARAGVLVSRRGEVSKKASMPSQFQSPELQAWAAGFPITLLHVGVTLLILVAGASLYALLTPHREIQLIREGNPAAALSFGGVLVGLAIPLAFALAVSTSMLEIALWGATTTAVQLALFWITDLLLHGLPQRIKEGEIAAAALLVAAKLAGAVILAAAVTA